MADSLSTLNGTPSGGPLDFGQAAGNQAQFGQLLQLLASILATLQGSQPGFNFFQVFPITAAGDLDISVTYPNARAGIFSIQKTVPAATQVTIPNYGGPWAVCDGSGVAGANPITVVGKGGLTILGEASYGLNFNWKFATFLLNGTNFLVGL